MLPPGAPGIGVGDSSFSAPGLQAREGGDALNLDHEDEADVPAEALPAAAMPENLGRLPSWDGGSRRHPPLC